MAIFAELRRFLDEGTVALCEVRALLADARRTLAALAPTVEALPGLVNETRGLVSEARSAVAKLTPLATDALADFRARGAGASLPSGTPPASRE